MKQWGRFWWNMLWSSRDSSSLLCPPNRRGGGDILFLVQIPSASASANHVASFPCVIFWTDGRILTKLAEIHGWEGGTSWLDFCDLGPIFKVTATFNVWNFVSVRYLMNQLTDLDQTCTDTMLGGVKSWVDFDDLGPIFKVTATFFNVWNFVSVRYLMKQLTDLDQTCTDTMLGGCEELIRFWWPWPNFQCHSDFL